MIATTYWDPHTNEAYTHVDGLHDDAAIAWLDAHPSAWMTGTGPVPEWLTLDGFSERRSASAKSRPSDSASR